MTISTPTTRPGRWISMLLIVLGAIGIVYGVGSGVVRGFASHAATSDTFTADVEGVDELQIDSSATAFEIRFGDVDQATLDVTTNGGPVQQWHLSRSGGTLVVDTDRRWRWFGFGIMFGDRVGEERAVLTLPAALERQGLGLETEISAGSFEAAGDWGAASIDLSAGSADLSGTAESLFVSVSAGEARLDVETAGTVALDVSASAGSIDLTIPDGEYAVTEQASAGDSDVRVVDDPNAASTIDVDVSAGSVTLRGDDR